MKLKVNIKFRQYKTQCKFLPHAIFARWEREIKGEKEMTKRERADAVFKCYCDFLDGKNFKYQRDESERSIILQITGEDFPMTTLFKVEEEHERTFVFSKIPFEAQKEKLTDLIMATTFINQVLAIGAFCVDTENLYCSFESNEIYTGLEGFNAEYAERVIISAFSAIEKYNDKLFAINKGLMTVRDFSKQL